MKLSQVVNKGNPRWRVSAYIRGQRRQRFFKSRRKARLWIKSLEADEGCDGFWGQRTKQEQLEIMEAFSASRKQGLSLLKAVSVYQGKGRKWPTPVRAAVSTYLTSIENHSYRPTSHEANQVQPKSTGRGTGLHAMPRGDFHHDGGVVCQAELEAIDH